MGASDLTGLSVVSVENSTEHHILIFYDGPERFFLRLNPYRHGSAVLADGAYAVGVMASSDEVVPYRARLRYAGERVLHRYFIEERGGGQDRGLSLITSARGRRGSISRRVMATMWTGPPQSSGRRRRSTRSM